MTNTDPRTTTPAITIEFRDDRPDAVMEFSAEQAAGVWETLMDDEGSIRLAEIMYAAWTVPGKGVKGYRTNGTFGTPADEMPAPRERESAIDAEGRVAAARERAYVGDIEREGRALHRRGTR